MSGRRPEGRGAFLGTQEIVQRLRATRPARFGAVPRPLGGAVLVAAVCLVWGQVARERLVGRRSTPAAAVASAAPTPEADPEASALASDAAPRHEPVRGGEAAQVRLSVVVRGAPRGAELRVDGVSVGPAASWEGRLSRGPHALSVRSRAGEQSYVVQLQGPQEVVFEPRTRRVHARSLHEHAHKGR